MKKTQTMRIVLVALTAVMLLSGCEVTDAIGETWDKAWSYINCLLHPIDCATGGRNLLSVLGEKYWPTDWYWWVLGLFVVIYLPIRKPKTLVDMKLPIAAVLVFFCALIATIVTWFEKGSPVMVIISIAIALVVFKGATAVIGTITGVGLKALMGAKVAAKTAIEYASTDTSHKGTEAEKDLDKEWAGKYIFALLSVLFLMTVCFGGKIVLPWAEGDPGQKLDIFLRGAGIAVAGYTILLFLYDSIWNSHWVCHNHECEKFVFDWLRNKEFCPHCDFFNPLVGWKCDEKLQDNRICGQGNWGKELVCTRNECGKARPRAQRWIDRWAPKLRPQQPVQPNLLPPGGQVIDVQFPRR